MNIVESHLIFGTIIKQDSHHLFIQLNRYYLRVVQFTLVFCQNNLTNFELENGVFLIDHVRSIQPITVNGNEWNFFFLFLPKQNKNIEIRFP